jgi:6-phosphogluconolactonase
MPSDAPAQARRMPIEGKADANRYEKENRMVFQIKRGLRSLAALTAFTVAVSIMNTQAHAAPASSTSFMYVATYTNGTSKGIYSYRFDEKTGKITPIGLAAEIANPGFLATDPQHRFLYAVTERAQKHDPDAYKKEGTISSYAIDRRTGALTFLNKVSSTGGGPCHLVVDEHSKMLFVANYGTGSIASFALNPDGSIGDRTGFDQHTGSSVNKARQEGPHAHEAVLSPDHRFLFVPDLGTDQIKIYKIDAAKRTFIPNDPAFVAVKAGLGPRHFAFGKDGRFAYVVCEMGSSVVAFSYDAAKGQLTPLQTIYNLPTDFQGEDNSAEIGIAPSGHFVYASNRGHDSITVYAVDHAKGTLTTVQNISSEGKIPRNFAIDPTGRYLVVGNQMSNQLKVFSVNQKDGTLKPMGETTDLAQPICILFVPEG